MVGLLYHGMEREQTLLARRQIQISIATVLMLAALTVTTLYSLLLLP
ncbi:MAG: hypothetical protein KJ955_00090 [Nanoarchaeota archaeon]|nr:hypothetical protein [Nanoarchaeota archaeon]